MALQAAQAATPARNRLDHILPRSYLEGFTNPSKQGQLSVFDRRGRRWFAASTDGMKSRCLYNANRRPRRPSTLPFNLSSRLRISGVSSTPSALCVISSAAA